MPAAVIAIVIGTGLGVALVSSIRSQGITDTFVPVSNLLVFLIRSGLLGLVAASSPARLVAASRPARRAARLDVLAAVAAE